MFSSANLDHLEATIIKAPMQP